MKCHCFRKWEPDSPNSLEMELCKILYRLMLTHQHHLEKCYGIASYSADCNIWIQYIVTPTCVARNEIDR